MTAHRAIKMESIHTKTRMKGQGSRELVDRLKKETEKEDKIDNLLQAWLPRTRRFLYMNDLALDRLKVFC